MPVRALWYGIVVGCASVGLCASGQTAMWNNPEGGDLLDPQNWTFLDDPGPWNQPQNMIFSLDEGYSVWLEGFHGANRMLVERGSVLLGKTPSAAVYEFLQLFEDEPFNPPGLMVGGLASEASLRTGFSVFAHDAFVGMSLQARMVFLDDFLATGDVNVGGLDVLLLDEHGTLIQQHGEMWFYGEESYGSVGAADDGYVSMLTLAQEDVGSLRISAGAMVDVESARFAVNEGSIASVLVEGEGSVLHMDSVPEFGEGHVSIEVADGAFLSGEFPDGILPSDIPGLQTYGLVFRNGGGLLGITGIGEDRFDGETLAGDARSLSVLNSALTLDTLSGTGELLVLSGSELLIRDMMDYSKGSSVRIENSSLRVLEPDEPPLLSPNRLNMVLLGQTVVLSDSTLESVMRDSNAGPPHGSNVVIGGLPPENSIVVEEGTEISVDGVLWFLAQKGDISISGPGTRVDQRRALFEGGFFGDRLAGGVRFLNGQTIRSGTGMFPQPELNLADGVAIDADLLVFDGFVVRNTSATPSPIQTRLLFLERGTLELNLDMPIETEWFVLGEEGSGFMFYELPGRLAGGGVLGGTLINFGIVDPASEGRSVVVVTGSYDQRSQHLLNRTFLADPWNLTQGYVVGGLLCVDLHRDTGGALEADRLIVTDEAMLGGVVEFRFGDSYVPRSGDSFMFVQAGQVIDEFEVARMPETVPSGLIWELEYTDTSVMLRFGSLGDLNGDNEVDSIDLGLLLAQWGARDTSGDLDGSGNVDGGDLGVLLANWTG
ncbi:MAG: hypothetical protein ACF8GE_08060 [Phycisphaerales bacterium JB043]